MHGPASLAATAFVTSPPLQARASSSSNHVDALRTGPLSMMAGLETELFGLTKDVVTAAATAAAGDAIAQFAEQRRKASSLQAEMESLNNPYLEWDETPQDGMSILEEFDFELRRTASYGAFAAAYTGGFQHYLFENLHETVPDPVMRLALNQGLIIPLCYYSMLVAVVPKLRAQTPEEEDELRSSIDVMKMIPRNWLFWVPLQFVQFNFIPTDYQVIYCSFLGLLWNIILSTMTSGGKTTTTEPAIAESPVLSDVTISLPGLTSASKSREETLEPVKPNN